MKRVYLDHKDFINMARGLRREAQHAQDEKSYRTLLKHVEDGSLTFYFSATHLLEAVRYQGDSDLRREGTSVLCANTFRHGF